jgi:hypothetical protein
VKFCGRPCEVEISEKPPSRSALAAIAQIIGKVAWYEDYYNNRRPHTELNGLMPHEKFYGKKTARQIA